MKHWTQIFKVLANYSRLKILKLLSDGEARSVSDIARDIHVTFRGTSRHLNLLYAMDLLTNDGHSGHVYYSLNKKMPADAKRAVELVIHFPKSI
ncbi:MAG: metalloregulator ArsR/SmtB family transcription factor [bacterium]|nr:metalloregulator ArsR/SmtB family transcription factor [bacterium]